MSRAVLNCPRCGRPEALRNVLRYMPSLRALAVILRAKLRSEPLMFSAITVATSLADLVTRARIASSTVIRWPRRSPSRDAGWRAARAETRSLLSTVHSFDSSASKTRYMVIILVSEAG